MDVPRARPCAYRLRVFRRTKLMVRHRSVLSFYDRARRDAVLRPNGGCFALSRKSWRGLGSKWLLHDGVWLWHDAVAGIKPERYGLPLDVRYGILVFSAECQRMVCDS